MMGCTLFQKVSALKNDQIVCDHCKIADSFFDRLIGLIGTNHFEAGQGLFLARCNSIHMWFMNIAIDVVFLRRVNTGNEGIFTITSTRENVPAWKFFPLGDYLASDTLELPVGTIQRCGLTRGDEICIS